MHPLLWHALTAAAAGLAGGFSALAVARRSVRRRLSNDAGLPQLASPLPPHGRYAFDEPWWVIAHRGLACYATENTAAAIALAAASGANAIEVDVYLTRDRVPVLIHDRDLRRLLGLRGLVYEKTWAELSRLRLRPANRLLTLEEFLAAYAGQFDLVLLDLKHFRHGPVLPEDVPRLVELVQRSGHAGRVVADTCRWEAARRFAELGQRASLRAPQVPPRELLAAGVRQILLDAARPDFPARLAAYRGQGLEIVVATENRPAAAIALFRGGVRGVITDAVGEVLSAVAAAGAARRIEPPPPRLAA